MAELSFYIPTRLAVVELPDTSISVQEIVDQFRDFEDNPETMVHRRMLHAEGKLALPDGSNMIVAAAMLDGWRIQFIDRPGPTIIECQISGGNIIAYTGELGVGPQIPVAPSTFVFASFAAATTGAILTSSAFDADVNLMRKILDNRLETDPVAGVMTLYDDDGITPIRTWNIWEDILQVQAYRSRGMERRDAGV